MLHVQKILEQTIPPLGFELVDVEITPAKTIRVFIDKEGGVTVDDCEFVSNHLSRLFMVENIEYNRLEISSPGLDRPLKKLSDFTRFTNQLVKIKTREVVDGQKVFHGHIAGVDGDKIKLLLKDEGREMMIAFADIMRARLVFEDPKAKNVKGKKAKNSKHNIGEGSGVNE